MIAVNNCCYPVLAPRCGCRAVTTGLFQTEVGLSAPLLSHPHQPLLGLLLLIQVGRSSDAASQPPALALLLGSGVPAGFCHSQDLARAPPFP